MCSASRKELIEVIKYFRDEFNQVWHRFIESGTHTGLALIKTGTSILCKTRDAARQAKET